MGGRCHGTPRHKDTKSGVAAYKNWRRGACMVMVAAAGSSPHKQQRAGGL